MTLTGFRGPVRFPAPMKCLPACSVFAILCLAACETMTAPITGGDFDPLRPPGSNQRPNEATGISFKAGQFVRAAMDNTALFKTRPKGDGDADKLLPRGTSMKVISTSGSYVQVELDSGEIGYVPTVMVEDPNALPTGATTNPGEYQIYPPLPTTGVGEPLPIIDPAGLPPEGAIPTVIDPTAPTGATVPPVTPTTDTFPTPKPESTPLPPNDEDKAAEKKQ